MSDKERVVLYLNEETAEAFRKQVAAMYGKADGNMSLAGENAIREWTDKDRAARIEDKLDTVLAQLDAPECERERNSAVSQEPTTPSDRRHAEMVEMLPDSGWVGEDVVERCIADASGDSRGTLKKYKKRMLRQGDLIKLPDGVAPDEDERYAVSATTWAIRAENDDAITLSHIDTKVGELEPELGEDWYLEALPDPFIENNQLMYDEIQGITLDSEQYINRNGAENGNGHRNGHRNGHEVTSQ